jgi:hypothetical protein
MNQIVYSITTVFYAVLQLMQLLLVLGRGAAAAATAAAAAAASASTLLDPGQEVPAQGV